MRTLHHPSVLGILPSTILALPLMDWSTAICWCMWWRPLCKSHCNNFHFNSHPSFGNFNLLVEQRVIDVGEDDDDNLGDNPKLISNPTHCDNFSSVGTLQTSQEECHNHQCQWRFEEDMAVLSMDPTSVPIILLSQQTLLHIPVLTAFDAPNSLDILPFYIATLSLVMSPDTLTDVPFRVLWALFKLLGHTSGTWERIAMVR